MKEQQKDKKIVSLRPLIAETLWVGLSVGVGKGNMEEIVRSKNIGYLGCELKLNRFFSGIFW